MSGAPLRDLVNSKLGPPLPPAACIERPALLARLDQAWRHKAVVIAGPIGSGKTTLLTQWHRRAARSRAVVWLSLDERDNEPVRFFAYLIGAVRRAVVGFDAYISSRHGHDAAPHQEAAASVFCDSLERIHGEIVVVLDDFQCLSNSSLMRALDFLVQRSPDTVHWVICGRCLPDINLSPLKLADRLDVIEAADLNLDTAMIAQLGRKLYGRELTAHEAEDIRSRTEGWVAGTKLALLAAVDGAAAAGEPAQPFAGSHCEVARYLGASVLHEQSADVRDFLIASSVVDRMTGELCNAVIGITGSQTVLERLERLQLFIQPLDSHRQWYRYHTLFLDFLRSQLRRDAARAALLHERASRWFSEHQLYEEALGHAFQASNVQWRIELVGRCASTWLQEGEIANVIRWSERLQRSEALGDARVCTAYIAALVLCRRFDDAVVTLREVEARGAVGCAPRAVHLRLLHMMGGDVLALL